MRCVYLLYPWQIYRTPILREKENSQGGPTTSSSSSPTADAAGAAGAAATPDVASFHALSREQTVADQHPLALPRVKQRRPRRAITSSTITAVSALRRASTTGSSASAPAASSGGGGGGGVVASGNDDPFRAAFGGSGSSTNKSHEDLLSQLWLPQTAPVAAGSAPAGGNGDGVVPVDSNTAPSAALPASLSDDDERVRAEGIPAVEGLWRLCVIVIATIKGDLALSGVWGIYMVYVRVGVFCQEVTSAG